MAEPEKKKVQCPECETEVEATCDACPSCGLDVAATLYNYRVKKATQKMLDKDKEKSTPPPPKKREFKLAD
jgi:hypothetical protein